MKIAVYSITRDRLFYTKLCFNSLKEKAGIEYDHYVFDNGSKDGTVEWLKENIGLFEKVEYSGENQGISKASNRAIENILNSGKNYDMIVKFDNDCFVETMGTLKTMSELFEQYPNNLMVISPSVNGLVNSPPIKSIDTMGKHGFAHTNIVGGLFHCTSPKLYTEKGFRYNENLPLGKGQDDEVCLFARMWGGFVGYVQKVFVQHYETTDGQAKRFPDYFKRKWSE